MNQPTGNFIHTEQKYIACLWCYRRHVVALTIYFPRIYRYTTGMSIKSRHIHSATGKYIVLYKHILFLSYPSLCIRFYAHWVASKLTSPMKLVEMKEKLGDEVRLTVYTDLLEQHSIRLLYPAARSAYINMKCELRTSTTIQRQSSQCKSWKRRHSSYATMLHSMSPHMRLVERCLSLDDGSGAHSCQQLARAVVWLLFQLLHGWYYY